MRKEDRQVGWGRGERKDEDGKKSRKSERLADDTSGVRLPQHLVCHTWNPTKYPQASELGACLHFTVRLRFTCLLDPQSMSQLLTYKSPTPRALRTKLETSQIRCPTPCLILACRSQSRLLGTGAVTHCPGFTQS